MAYFHCKFLFQKSCFVGHVNSLFLGLKRFAQPVADPAGGGTLAVTMPPVLSTYFHCRKFNQKGYNGGLH